MRAKVIHALELFLAASLLMPGGVVPSFASDWRFYGSVRIKTFWEFNNFGDLPTAGTVPGEGFIDNEDTDLIQGLQDNSRIGANVKFNGRLSARFEYATKVNLRILWGEYDFGIFKLGLGQHYTPINQFFSNQVFFDDAILHRWGALYDSRRPMVRFRVGGLDFALVSPSTPNSFAEVDTRAATTIDSLLGAKTSFVDTDVIIPKLEARYIHTWQGIFVELNVGYHNYGVVADDLNGKERNKDITSYVFGGGVKVPFGPFYVNAGVYYGQNLGNLGLFEFPNNPGNKFAGLPQANAAFDPNRNDIVDNKTYGLLGVVGFKAGDMLRFEAGAGYANHELDYSKSTADDVLSYYVQAGIGLAKGVWLWPEVGVVDYRDDARGVDEGDEWYAGMKWQINF